VRVKQRLQRRKARFVTPPPADVAAVDRLSQLQRVRDFQAAHRTEAADALARLKAVATSQENVFAVLMDAARVCTLGQITEAFFEVGGAYRRNV